MSANSYHELHSPPYQLLQSRTVSSKKVWNRKTVTAWEVGEIASLPGGEPPEDVDEQFPGLRYLSEPNCLIQKAGPVHLLRHRTRLNIFTCTEQDLDTASHVALEFTNQKNGVRGELVGLGRSGHPSLCPVKAVIARLKHLRIFGAAPAAQLYHYHDGR